MKKKINHLTDQEKEYIKANYKGVTCKAMIDKLLNEFGVEHGRTQIQQFYHANNLHSGLTGCFEKGNIPMNKGKKQTEYMTKEQIEKTKKTRFNKGHINDNSIDPRPVGSRTLRCDGYVWVKVAEPHIWIPEHKYIWELHNGKQPKGTKIIHLDCDRTNNDINNLVLIKNGQMAIMNRFMPLTNNKEVNKALINITELIVKTRALKDEV